MAPPRALAPRSPRRQTLEVLKAHPAWEKEIDKDIEESKWL